MKNLASKGFVRKDLILNLQGILSDDLIDQIADRVIEKMKVAQNEQPEVIKQMIDEVFRLRAMALRKI